MYKSTKFEVCQAKGSQDIEWSVYSYVQFDPWPFDLKINSGHLLSMMYKSTKFEVCQAKGSQDIE
jgi:polyhydroxyalkanoate synthesis regulator protein